MPNTIAAAAEGLPAPTLLNAIAALEAGEKAYDALPIVKLVSPSDEQVEAACAETYALPLQLLQKWDQPATTREEALEALRLAEREANSFACSDVIGNMLRAAIGYFAAPAVSPSFQAAADKFAAALAEYRVIDDRMAELLNSLPNDVLFGEGSAARAAKESAGVYKLDELQAASGGQCAEALTALLEYPCASLEEVQTKVRLVLSAPSGFGGDLEYDEAKTLLRSFIGAGV